MESFFEEFWGCCSRVRYLDPPVGVLFEGFQILKNHQAKHPFEGVGMEVLTLGLAG